MVTKLYIPQLNSGFTYQPALLDILVKSVLANQTLTDTNGTSSKCSASNCGSTQLLNSLNIDRIPRSSGNETVGTKWPLVDILEYPDSYNIVAELPGFGKDEIDLDFDESDNKITIKGQKVVVAKTLSQEQPVVDTKESPLETENGAESLLVHNLESEVPSFCDVKTSTPGLTKELNTDSNPTVLLQECKIKDSFKRSFKFKKSVLVDQISAKFEDGLLEITIPIASKDQNVRRLKIN